MLIDDANDEELTDEQRQKRKDREKFEEMLRHRSQQLDNDPRVQNRDPLNRVHPGRGVPNRQVRPQ